ncbi:caspase family protein [Streptomyces sp. NBC_01728]|uniref:caspase family protein n=1 Tax=unclassified Streptomyces TaxID=2593676 RepID=UPI0022571133|nr:MULTISPECIES: caspase family protein [unclassified Streptomyces]MCX4460314.1 caspase family protein [Streptomyces sp. NBC_01719]MCX4500355.1 caspase family protein [Streptomyces sp. NBC_01728]
MASRALIIANSRYDDDHFAALPAAAADAAELANVLGDPAVGDFSVDTLVDVEQRPAMRALESFFTQASSDDLLLLHLPLHGWKDLRNRLYFVMCDTERDYPGSTAISADTIGTWMSESRSRRIVVMLDCCYSGAFTMNALRRDAGAPIVDIAEPFAGNGRVVLTASTALQYAHEGEQDVRYSRTPAQPSVFTSAVVNGLRDGSADLDGDGLVSVDELYDYVHEQVRQRIAGQTPTLSVDSAQGTIYLARSPRHATPTSTASPRCDPPWSTPSPGNALAPSISWSSCSAAYASRPGTRRRRRCSGSSRTVTAKSRGEHGSCGTTGTSTSSCSPTATGRCWAAVARSPGPPRSAS